VISSPYSLASIHVHCWRPETAPKAAVVIVHGMGEHGGRYARLAEQLTARGIVVHAPDLPGHGLSVHAPEDLGWIDDQHGWSLLLGAVHRVRHRAATELEDGPVFVLGHSMGSFLTQHYLVDHGAGLAGAILSATSGTMGPLRVIGLGLLWTEARLRGRRHPSAIAQAMSFKRFNRAFAPNRTAFDWLSRDPAEVDRYIADPLCGKPASAQLWIDLMEAGANLLAPERLAQIPKALPIHLIAGDRDPVSLGARGPNLLADAYRIAGLRDVSVRIWPDARHELLNDTCRDEVMTDLSEWLSAKILRAGAQG